MQEDAPQPPSDQGRQEQAPQPLPLDERLERLSRIVSTRTLEGWVVIDRNDRDVSAVLALPEKPVNHTLHAIITIFSCLLWAPIWAVLALTHRREQRVRMSIDLYGNLLEERMTI